MVLTLVLRIDNKLAHHRLDDTYISIERTADEAATECHPKVQGEANDKKGGNGTDTSHDKNGLATYPIR